jgi:hypothetical protein
VDLPVDFAAMGEFAGRMIRSAVQALLEGDARLADTVREMDDEIDRMNRRAHADLLKLIQEKPRFTQQAMNGILVSRNLERIADHARISLRCDFLGSRRGCAAPAQHVDGLKYNYRIRRETLFAEGMAGVGGANKNWGAGGSLSQTASFASFLGGGLDTAITRHVAFRVEGGFQYSYFSLQHSSTLAPYRIPGLPTYFGRISAGPVWEF